MALGNFLKVELCIQLPECCQFTNTNNAQSQLTCCNTVERYSEVS